MHIIFIDFRSHFGSRLNSRILLPSVGPDSTPAAIHMIGSMDVAAHSGDTSGVLEVGCWVVPVKFVPAQDAGYLALAPGEKLQVKYLGTKATQDSGWLFGRCVATGKEGWFSEALVARLDTR